MRDYPHQILCEYLEFGFPLNIDCQEFSFQNNITNHSSAIRNKKAIVDYFPEETSHSAMACPFEALPFINTHFSPLPWPQSGGVNAFVSDDRLDCLHVTLAYPTIDHLVTQISKIGPQALLYKVDLQRT